MTYLIMGVVLFALAFILLFKVQLTEDTFHFFNLQNTIAMRGFWCIIVILVHIPAVYQNRIQDMIGSFAYIGVTFFFMTSAYGLKVGMKKDPDSIKMFWRRRLPKLIVPMLIVNVLSMVMRAVEGKNISWVSLISLNGWVLWLLTCYVIYWTVNRLIPARGGQDLLVCILIVMMSVIIYSQKSKISTTTWCPEVFGFVWGIILANGRDHFVAVVKRKWVLACVVLCLMSGTLGILYLKYKPVPVYGDYLLKIILGVAITTFILSVNVRLSFGNKASLFLGKISYEIYLLHGAVFGLLATFMSGINSGVFIALSIIITVMLSWMVSVVSQPLIKGINKVVTRHKT